MANETPGLLPLSFGQLHPEVQLAKGLYADGYFQDAVRKAAERFSNRVAEKAERGDMTGKALMNHVFSAGKPSLIFSEERTTMDEQDWHEGYRSLAVGLSVGVRNVYTHRDELPVNNVEAMEWIAFISAMHRRLDRAVQYVPPLAEATEQPDAPDV